MSDPHPPRLDRTALSVAPLFDNSDEARYWRARTAAERLRHVETLRRINYGSRATEGLQRIVVFAPRSTIFSTLLAHKGSASTTYNLLDHSVHG